MTTAPGVFAGGDCVFGPRLIIDSVGDGKRIALRHRRVSDRARASRTRDRSRSAGPSSACSSDFMNLSRQPVPMLPLDRRTGVTEVEIGYDEASAMREARRCLRCWINTVFEGNEPDGSQCILCGGCVDVCPENCLQLVPLERSSFRRRCWSRFRPNPSSLPRGTGRRGRRGTGRHHRLGHVEGRNPVHPLRPVRGALPGERDHDGSVFDCAGATMSQDANKREQ